MSIALIMMVGFIASLAMTPIVARFAASRRLFDLPGGRRVHTRPIPRLGGVSVYASLLAGVAVLVAYRLTTGQPMAEEPVTFLGMILGGTGLFLAGLRDDLRPLSPLAKLRVQCIVALVVFALGVRVEVISFGPLGVLEPGLFSLPLTILWIVGITNAINLIDGLDGLATGLALIAAVALMAMAGITGQGDELFLAAALIGALAGFLVYNFNPARIFLGDSGSYSIGFMLSVLALRGSFAAESSTPVVVPLLIFALPILDVLLAIARRWIRGAPLFGPDADHIHHRLLALGFTHRRAVLAMYAAAIVLAGLGLIITIPPTNPVFAVSVMAGVGLVVVLAYGVHRLRYREFRAVGTVLRLVALRIPRVIRTRIQAQDLSQLLAQAASVGQARNILADNASRFGFLDIEFARLGELEIRAQNRYGPGAVRVDYPVESPGSDPDDPFVIRVWYHGGNGTQPGNAEWVAQVLEPALDRVLQQSLRRDALVLSRNINGRKEKVSS